ncbi:MAG TPA: hydrogenase subunit MbhD domain-containing protein [Candidatus Methylomirabilis sp.]|nr:hydrogenase subunit MbhD domain-containing protein [Candidatus Methylomirabilis sp.]
MTPDLAIDIGLAVLVLGVAAWTTVVRESFAAVVGFVTYGLLLALAWVRLHAVDVALTEAAIGGGVTGALLLAAAARLGPAEDRTPGDRPGAAPRLLAAVLCALVSAGLGAIVLLPPDPAPTLAPAAVASLPKTGLGNPVTAVLLAYRAWDTFLEKAVLVLALLGVWSLAPDALWGGRPGPAYRAQRDGALALLARVLPPAGIVMGVYMLWTGADEPGGAFPAGTILAAMWILVMRAGLADAPAVGRRSLRVALVAGAVVFLAVGLSGLATAGAFLAYPVRFAKPLIVLIEAPLTFSIAVTLGLLAAGPPERGLPR